MTVPRSLWFLDLSALYYLEVMKQLAPCLLPDSSHLVLGCYERFFKKPEIKAHVVTLEVSLRGRESGGGKVGEQVFMEVASMVKGT